MIAFPPVPAGEPVKVSATTYLAFKQCPAQAQARYEGHYPPETRPSFVGALTHRLIARHLQSGPIADVRLAVKEEIGAALNSKMGAAGIRKPSDLEQVIAQVGELYARFRRFPIDGFEAAEVELEAEPLAGVTLVGKVDVVLKGEEGDQVLRDWKTGALGSPFDQLLFYALLWALREDRLPGMVEAVSLQTGERVSRTPTLTDLAAVARLVADLVTAIRSVWSSGPASDGRGLDRRGGPWCRYCPLLPDCSEGQSVMSLSH
ncbi:MAG: PD-(D/E)XK nuclease family protein [Actinomycetota bacterium]